jgi:hypothetical protein
MSNPPPPSTPSISSLLVKLQHSQPQPVVILPTKLSRWHIRLRPGDWTAFVEYGAHRALAEWLVRPPPVNATMVRNGLDGRVVHHVPVIDGEVGLHTLFRMEIEERPLDNPDIDTMDLIIHGADIDEGCIAIHGGNPDLIDACLIAQNRAPKTSHVRARQR